jgi:hypothetical protein
MLGHREHARFDPIAALAQRRCGLANLGRNPHGALDQKIEALVLTVFDEFFNPPSRIAVGIESRRLIVCAQERSVPWVVSSEIISDDAQYAAPRGELKRDDTLKRRLTGPRLPAENHRDRRHRCRDALRQLGNDSFAEDPLVLRRRQPVAISVIYHASKLDLGCVQAPNFSTVVSADLCQTSLVPHIKALGFERVLRALRLPSLDRLVRRGFLLLVGDPLGPKRHERRDGFACDLVFHAAFMRPLGLPSTVSRRITRRSITRRCHTMIVAHVDGPRGDRFQTGPSMIIRDPHRDRLYPVICRLQ